MFSKRVGEKWNLLTDNFSTPDVYDCMCACMRACCIPVYVYNYVLYSYFTVCSASNVHRFSNTGHHASVDPAPKLGVGPLQLSVNVQTGDYKLVVGKSPWLQSAPTFFTSRWKQHNSAPGGGLNFIGTYTNSGTDNLGAWSSTVFRYNLVNQAELEIQTEFRVYSGFPDTVLFGQVGKFSDCYRS